MNIITRSSETIHELKAQVSHGGARVLPARAKESLQSRGSLSVSGGVVLSQTREMVLHVPSHG